MALITGRIVESHIADVARLEADIFPDAWSEAAVRETFCQNQAVILGAWEGETLVGYLIFYYVLDEGEIARIAVDASCRRQGAAGCLFSELVKWCAEKQIRKIMLDVRESNAAAIAFYRKCGFTGDGIRKRYYTDPVEDAVLMSMETDGRFDNSSH